MQAPEARGRAAQHNLAVPSRALVGKTAEHQTIRRWSIVGNDRLIGRIFHRPGTADGEIIMTSPVVQVRFMGVDRTPIAFTESGNAYWLGPPAENFGLDRAQTFVWHKSRDSEAPPRQPKQGASDDATTLFRLD